MMIQLNVSYNCKNFILQKTYIYSGPDSVQKGKVKYFSEKVNTIKKYSKDRFLTSFEIGKKCGF